MVVSAWRNPSTRASSAGTACGSICGAIDGRLSGGDRLRRGRRGQGQGVAVGGSQGAWCRRGSGRVGLGHRLSFVPPDRREQIYPAARPRVLFRSGQPRSGQTSSSQPRSPLRWGDLARSRGPAGWWAPRWSSAGELSPSIRANTRSAAMVPIRAGSCAITVTPGSSTSPNRTSSKPTIATACWQPELVQRPDGTDGDHVLAGEQRGGWPRATPSAPQPLRGRLLRTQVVDEARRRGSARLGPWRRRTRGAVRGPSRWSARHSGGRSVDVRARSDAGWRRRRTRGCRSPRCRPAFRSAAGPRTRSECPDPSRSSDNPDPGPNGVRISPSTRRRVKAAISRRSRCGSSSKLAANTAVSRRVATFSTARLMAAENGLSTASSNNPMVSVLRSPRRKRPRAEVRLEVQGEDCTLDTFAGLCGDIRLIVDDSRYRLDAYSGQGGDIADGRPWSVGQRGGC